MSAESTRLAAKEILARRENAIAEAQNRALQMAREIPQIGELNFLLAQTGRKIAHAVLRGNGAEAIRKIQQETSELYAGREHLLREHGYPADYLEVPYTCPFCEDTGYYEGKKCSCFRKLIQKYDAAEFSRRSRITMTDFASFSLRYYSPHGEENGVPPRQIMGEILSFCVAYAAGFEKNSPSVLMMGDTGLGKTHLSLAIAKQVMERGFSVLYVSAPDLFRTLQNEYYGRGEPGSDTMELLLNTDLVIIDDLGAEMENQFNSAAFYNLVNTRLNAEKPLLINTNLKPKELESRYSARTTSRLMTMFKCLKFVGRDVRQIKLKNHEI